MSLKPTWSTWQVSGQSYMGRPYIKKKKSKRKYSFKEELNKTKQKEMGLNSWARPQNSGTTWHTSTSSRNTSVWAGHASLTHDHSECYHTWLATGPKSSCSTWTLNHGNRSVYKTHTEMLTGSLQPNVPDSPNFRQLGEESARSRLLKAWNFHWGIFTTKLTKQ